MIHIIRGDTRLMFSCLELCQPRYNRAIPLYSSAAAFDLLPVDPRPIGPDMDTILVGHDPRGQLCLWREMEAAFGTTNPFARFRFMLTAPPTIAAAKILHIRTLAEAKDYVRVEAESWRGNFEGDGIYKRFGYRNPDTKESLERAQKMPAVGFWLFPLEAFGEVPSGMFQDTPWGTIELVDLSMFRPQLGLFRLPNDSS